MPLSAREIAQAAEDLYQAERSGTQIGLISLRFPGLSMEDAYAIQDGLVERKLAAGRAVIGWKIGLTSKAMQDALKIDTPDSGLLFDDMLFENDAQIPQTRFIQPRIEAEIAFVMARDLTGAPSRDEVLAATDYVVPALEILDTRILRKDPETGALRVIHDTIADNAANAGIVMGDAHHEPGEHDMRWVGAIVSKNGIVEETGLGAGVLDDPPLAVAWLAERLSRYGRRIRAGDIVLSGSFIRPIEATPGSTIEADYGAFGRVSVRF